MMRHKISKLAEDARRGTMERRFFFTLVLVTLFPVHAAAIKLLRKA